jgi:hypothetical protein
LTYDEGEKYVCKGVEQLGGQIWVADIKKQDSGRESEAQSMFYSQWSNTIDDQTSLILIIPPS